MSHFIPPPLVGLCRAAFPCRLSAAPAKGPPRRSRRGTLSRGPRPRRALFRVFHENTASLVAAAKPLRGVLKFCPTSFAPCHRLSSRQLAIWLRCPVSRRILRQGFQEHRAERGPLAHGADARGPLKLAGDAAHQVDACGRHPSEHARSHVHWPPTDTMKWTVSSRYGDGMYARSRRISFNFFAFSASAGKSTSSDWMASCPGSSRSLPYVANLRVGSVRLSSSLIGCPWTSMYLIVPATRRTV